MHLIGLDIGTTGCKAALYTDDGSLVASAQREYPIDVPRPTWVEQDAEHVWKLAQSALHEVVTGRTVTGAISLSVQGEAIIPVDAQGYALRPAILGMDTRTGEQNDWLRQRFGASALFKLTGMPIHTINTLPKLLWIRQHEPEVWHNAARFVLYEDFLIKKMTDSAVISDCLASRTQLLDTRSGRWSSEILSALSLDPDRLSSVEPSGTCVGKMGRALAEALGFAEPPDVVTGGHDQACGALGVGLTQPGLAMVSTGTAEVVEVSMTAPTLNDTLCEGNISVYRHVVRNLYLAMTLNHSGGLLLRWYRDTFCQEEMAQAHRQGRDPYDVILENVSSEPSPLLILPHFAGSGTPTFDTASKGAIIGLTFGTTKADMVKAIVEGLTFELRLNLDLLKSGHVAISELRAIGGGARSALWLQLKADITQIPVAVPMTTEAACWGAAILAGVGAGVYGSADETASARLQFERRIEPDCERAQRYTERYELYREMYPAIAPIAHRL